MMYVIQHILCTVPYRLRSVQFLRYKICSNKYVLPVHTHTVCYAILHYTILQYTMLYYAMLCYALLYYM